LPLSVVAPVLVAVEPARTAKLRAVPIPGADAANAAGSTAAFTREAGDAAGKRAPDVESSAAKTKKINKCPVLRFFTGYLPFRSHQIALFALSQMAQVADRFAGHRS
jgi:hypothetical protein